jgi:hypothetical protein
MECHLFKYTDQKGLIYSQSRNKLCNFVVINLDKNLLGKKLVNTIDEF